MSKTFVINELVETEYGAVGKVVEIRTDEDGILYHVDFLGTWYEEYSADDLRKTTKTKMTTEEGFSEDQMTEKALVYAEKADKQDKADALIDGIKQINNRYYNKCANGNTFWKFFEEDVEALIYKEMGAEKKISIYDDYKTYMGSLGGMSIYQTGKN